MTTIQLSPSISSLAWPSEQPILDRMSENRQTALSGWLELISKGVNEALRSITTDANSLAVESTSVSWRTQADFPRPRAQRLLDYARASLNRMSAEGTPASGVARETTDRALTEIITDTQPTPQIAIDEQGGVETTWLVNGTTVSLYVEPDGRGFFFAMDPAGTTLVDREFDPELNPLDLPTIAWAKDFLIRLGAHATQRVVH